MSHRSLDMREEEEGQGVAAGRKQLSHPSRQQMISSSEGLTPWGVTKLPSGPGRKALHHQIARFYFLTKRYFIENFPREKFNNKYLPCLSFLQDCSDP